MKKYLAALAAVGLIGAMSIAVPVLAGSDHSKGSDSVGCGENGTIVWSPTVLWPPNHKDVPITFTYTDADGGDVSLTIVGAHDEVFDGEELVGSGNTPLVTDAVGGMESDTDGSVDVVGSARSERSGTGDGRTYEFDYVADSNLGTDGCESDPGTAGDGLFVNVPHDCRAVDGGNSSCNDN